MEHFPIFLAGFAAGLLFHAAGGPALAWYLNYRFRRRWGRNRRPGVWR